MIVVLVVPVAISFLTVLIDILTVFIVDIVVVVLTVLHVLVRIGDVYHSVIAVLLVIDTGI
jgi:hypothetical protein